MTLPCELACCSRMRQAGQRRLEADRRGEVRRDRDDRGAGGDAYVAGVDLDAAVPPADRTHRRVEHDAVAELLGHPDRDELRAADDAVREALLRREELVRPSRAGDHPQPLEQRERVRRLRQEAVREVRAEVLACRLGADLASAATRRT